MEKKNEDYIVKAKFVFEGELKVYASSKDEAKQMVRDDFGMTFGEVQSTVPNILDWNINMKLIDIETQNRRILAHLQNGGTVTSLTALYDFGCLRLSGRIFELREAGYPVEDKWVETPSGKRVKMYFLRRSQSDSNLTSKRQHEPEAAAQMSIFDELRPITGE